MHLLQRTADDSTTFRTDVQRGAGTLHVFVHGDLDTLSAPDLQHVLARTWQGRLDALTVDLGGVTFLNASSLAVLFAARHRAVAEGTRFAVHGVPRAIARFLQVQGLELDAA